MLILSRYAGGLVGPMIIHGPRTVAYDIDKGPIILSDWFHRTYLSIVEDVVGTDVTKVVSSYHMTIPPFAYTTLSSKVQYVLML
jgi:FtsP/CotA-like multicopper oxidase with cupredoxin domain